MHHKDNICLVKTSSIQCHAGALCIELCLDRRRRWRSKAGEYEGHKGIQSTDVPCLNVLLHKAIIVDDILGRPCVGLDARLPRNVDGCIESPPACDCVVICYLHMCRMKLMVPYSSASSVEFMAMTAPIPCITKSTYRLAGKACSK